MNSANSNHPLGSGQMKSHLGENRPQKVIAWDTSSRTGCIVAFEVAPLRLVTELTLNVQMTHSERLLWGIHQVLEAAQWELGEVDLFGVGVGPGSFTGLRIGVTTARTLSSTLGKPLIGVSSLRLLSRPLDDLFHGNSKMIQIAATDACKGELFALMRYECPREGHQSFEQVLTPEDLQTRVKAALKRVGPRARWVVVGEGRHRYEDAWSGIPKRFEGPDFPFCDLPQGRSLALVVAEELERAGSHQGLEVLPRYLRASNAELERAKKRAARPAAPV